MRGCGCLEICSLGYAHQTFNDIQTLLLEEVRLSS